VCASFVQETKGQRRARALFISADNGYLRVMQLIDLLQLLCTVSVGSDKSDRSDSGIKPGLWQGKKAVEHVWEAGKTTSLLW